MTSQTYLRPLGTSKDLGNSVSPLELRVHVSAQNSCGSPFWIAALAQPSRQVLNISVSIECCTLLFTNEKKAVHLSLSCTNSHANYHTTSCLLAHFTVLLDTCILFMCGGLPLLLPILLMPSQLFLQELVAPGGSWQFSPYLQVSPVSEST